MNIIKHAARVAAAGVIAGAVVLGASTPAQAKVVQSSYKTKTECRVALADARLSYQSSGTPAKVVRDCPRGFDPVARVYVYVWTLDVG